MLTSTQTLALGQRIDVAAKGGMDELVAEYTSNPDASLVEMKRRGNAILEQCGLAAFEIVHPDDTLVHPWNRGDDMLEPIDVPQKIAEISDVGFDPNMVADASAVRMPTDPAEHAAIEAKNEKLVAAAGGILAPIVRGKATVIVTSCNHTTAGFKCANYGVACDIDRISDKGKMCKAKILQRQPGMADALNVGLRYFVYQYEVQKKWPEFIRLVIEASNASNTLSKPDTPLQLMYKIHKLVLAGDTDDIILRKILRAKPKFMKDVPAYIAYTRDWSGGSKPHLLDRFQEFSKRMKDCHPLPGTIVKALAGANMGTGVGGRYRLSAMMCIAAHGNFLESHAQTLSKRNLQNAIEAEKAMIIFESVVGLQRLQSINRSDIAFVISKHDMQQVMHVHSISKGFKTNRDISIEYFEQLVCASDLDPATINNPFKRSRAMQKSDCESLNKKTCLTRPSPDVVAVALPELAEGGGGLVADSICAMMHDKFAVNDKVCKLQGDIGKQKTIYKIADIVDATRVATLRVDGGSDVTVNFQAMIDNFKKDETQDAVYSSCKHYINNTNVTHAICPMCGTNHRQYCMVRRLCYCYMAYDCYTW
jgi:hypothetical protein